MYRFVSPVLTAVVAILIAGCSDNQQEFADTPVADLLLVSGRVYTLDDARSVAEAVAVADGEIVAVGSDDQVLTWQGADTEVIDLQDQVVMPGLHDMHVHPVFAGIQAGRCVIPQGADLTEIRRYIAECVAEAEPGDWILGGQWDSSAIGQIPTKEMIDDLTREHPLFLGDTSEHSFWANSAALDIASITRDTPNPPDGIIERDASGEPTGVLREDAALLVRAHIPEASDRQVRDALISSADQMLSFGVTSFVEASSGYSTNLEKEIRAYAELADSGELKQRVRICMRWEPDSPELDAVVANRDQYASDRIRPDCIKLMLDGVPTDSHTAAMLHPYVDTVAGRDDVAARYGLNAYEQNELNEIVTRFDSMGLTVKFHSSGDAAVRAGIDAIAAARAANGMNDQRHNSGHTTFIAPADIQKAHEVNATLELSPYLWSPSPISMSIALAVGPERVKRVWPFRDTIDSGALVVPGSDWSVVPSVNPWIGVETMITREEPGGSSASFGKEQAVSLDEAIELFTINSATQVGMGDRLGRIQTGYLADLIVLDRDPYAIPVTEIHQVGVIMTIIDGEIVYTKPDAAGEWFYLVKTEPSSPELEVEFNTWYDDIDIPDVLAVPGFDRARRAIGLASEELSQSVLRDDDGSYAALYDISSSDIDKSIIDLYVAARKMTALGRTTDALRVSEANYYQRVDSLSFADTSDASGEKYFYIQKILCCTSDADRRDFVNWFSSTHRTALSDTAVLSKASLYELYRIMEETSVGADEIPHLLALYEVSDSSPESAMQSLEAAIGDLSRSGPNGNSFEVRDSIFYRQLNEVWSD